MRSFVILLIALFAHAASGLYTQKVTLSCRDGYQLSGNNCYHVSEVAVTGSSLFEAANYCRPTNGSVAVIQSEAEMEMLKGWMLKTTTYLGINRQAQREHLYKFLLKMDGNTGYTNFQYGEPNSYSGEDCVVADATNNFQWKDVPCYETYPVLCKMPAYVKTSICREDELQMDTNTCFYGVGGDARHNWTEALQGCAARGMTLASIHTERENDAFAYMVKGPNPWIGLNDAMAEGGYAWSEGTPTDYVNWRADMNNDGDDRDCGYYFASSRQWGTTSCSGEAVGYLCRGPPYMYRDYTLY